MLKKVNEKKVLHKVKKQWVVLGTALFVLGTAGAYSESVHADTVVGDNHSSSTAVVTSSAATTTSQSADGGSSVANSKDASATSSVATSGSSTGTSSSASASQPATTTLQTDTIGQSSAVYTTEDQDGISFRDGDKGTTTGSTSYPTSSVSVSLSTSKPSVTANVSTSNINQTSDSTATLGIEVTGSNSGDYNQAVKLDSYSLYYANNGSNTQITGSISNLVQHVQLSGQNEASYAISPADYSSYVSFNPSLTPSDNIKLSDANVSGSSASSVSLLQLNSGPIGSGYYRPGDKVWWTFDVTKNSQFSGSSNTFYVPTRSILNTVVQIKYVDDSGNSLAADNWITGSNIYPGDTFSGIPVSNFDEYGYKGYNVSGNASTSSGYISGIFGYSDITSIQLNYGKILKGTVNYKFPPSVSGVPGGFSFSGTSGEYINFQSDVDSLAKSGYIINSTSPSLSSNVATIGNGDNVFNVYFADKTSNYDQNNSSYPSTFTKDDFSKSFTRTINFVDANDPSKSVSDPVTQSVTYNRSGVYDEVTKSMSYGSWTADTSSFAEIAAPSVASYENPQPASIAAQSVNAPNSDGSDSTSSATSVTIKYTESSGTPSDTEFSGTIRYIESNNSNSSIIPDTTIKGNSGEIVTDKLNGSDVDYSTQSVVDSLTSKGYKLVSGTPSSSLTINSSNNDYTFTFVHNKITYDGNSSSYPDKLTKDDFSKSFTRTINFIDADTKQPISSAATQTVSYNRSAVYDEVTKSTSFSSWSTSDSSFDEYSAPSIAGYKNPQPTSISASSVDTPDASGSDGTNASTSATISYTKAPSTSSSTTYTPYVAPKPASSSAVAGSDAPLIFYSASSSATSSSASSTTTSSSSVASSSVASNTVPSSTSSSVATGTIKMYNYKTELVKSNGQILIFIQPKYAPNDANGSLSNQFVVNQTLDNGQVSHDQQVTLDQYNSMLVASGKQPYTPETLNQAYVDRNDYKGILRNNEYKTTFDADVVKQGNNVSINTNTQTNGFNKPADNKLVSVNEVSRANTNGSDKKKTDKSKDKSKVKNKSKAKKQSAKKAKRAQKHVKKQAHEHNVTKHTHHVKHDRKQK